MKDKPFSPKNKNHEPKSHLPLKSVSPKKNKKNGQVAMKQLDRWY